MTSVDIPDDWGGGDGGLWIVIMMEYADQNREYLTRGDTAWSYTNTRRYATQFQTQQAAWQAYSESSFNFSMVSAKRMDDQS